jgi:hypothetical protein
VNKFRMIGAVALLASMAAEMQDFGYGNAGPPRRDRHGKRTRVEPDQFNTSKTKSAKLKRLLKK